MAKKRNSLDWEKFLNDKNFNHLDQDSYESEEVNSKKISEPSFYEVYLKINAQAPQDFISFILQNFFNRDEDDVDLNHMTQNADGEIFCGFYTKEIAESKVIEVLECCRNNKFDLKCIMRRGVDVSKKS